MFTAYSAALQRFLPSSPRRVKAPWQTVRFARRLARCACRSSFPKISLRCDFREPCLFFRARPLRTRGDFTSIRMLTREKRKKCDFSFFSYLFAQRGIYLLPFLRLKGFRDTFWNTPEGGRVRNDLPFCTRSLHSLRSVGMTRWETLCALWDDKSALSLTARFGKR